VKRTLTILVIMCAVLTALHASGQKESEAAAKPVPLRVMRSGQPDATRDFLLEAEQAFNREMDTDIDMEIVETDWKSYHSRIMVWVAAGQEPDLFITAGSKLYALLEADALLPLDDIIDSELRNDIQQPLWNAYLVDNKTYAIPTSAATMMLWYNKDLFKQAGLDPSEPPRNWDELLSYSQAITEKTPARGMGVNLGRAYEITMHFPAMLYYSATNRQLIDRSGKSVFETPEGVETTKFLVDLINKHRVTQPNPEQITKSDLRQQLRDGRIAMYVDGFWVMKMLKEVTDFSDPDACKFGIAHAPASPFSGKKALVPFNGEPWVVSSHSKNPDAAKRFLRFLVTPEWQMRHDLAISQMTFRPSVWKEYGRQDVELEDEWVFRKMSESIKDSIYVTPPVEKIDPAKEAFQNALVRMVLGEVSVEEGIEIGIREIDEALSD